MRTCVYPLIPQLFTKSGISAARSPLRSLRSIQINCHLRFSHVESTSQRSSADEGRHRMCTIPNILCVARIAATPAIGYLIVEEHFSTAFTLFIVAGLTDLADGYIARNFQGQKSLLGSVLDPVADKLLISVMFVAMSSAGLIPVSLTILVLLRDALLILGGIFKRYRTLDPPLSLARFFNPDVSPMQIVPTRVSKVNTVLQLAVVACSLANPVFEFGAAYQDASQLLNWTTAITTIYSGLQYASGSAFKKV